MQVQFGPNVMIAEWSASVACIGTFDGVHLGHRAVISTAVQGARSRELPSVLLTFDRHPATLIAPERAPKPISAVWDNLHLFEELGVSVAIVLPFDEQLRQMTAAGFLRTILRGLAKAELLVVGHDFAMGHDREGSTEWLSSHMPTIVLPPFELEGRRVSSSEIRADIQQGRVEEAARLLGKPFAITGVVSPGKRLGRTIGFPTANLARAFDQVMPGDGVYAGRLACSSGVYRAAVGIGVRPAVGGGPRTIEAFLIDYPGDSLYGQSVRLELLARLRSEQDFPSLDALRSQIQQDVEQTKQAVPSL